MLLTADPGRIDLWCAFVSEVPDERLWSGYQGLMSAEERAREARLRFARDQRRFRLTRALVRTVLSRYRPLEPQRWAFAAHERGRPYIAGPPPVPPIDFNLSHAGDAVVLGVWGGAVLGVDVEDVIGREAHIAGLERYFTRLESERLLALPPSARPRHFFELWTLKESYLKARGLGLAGPLDAFGFDLSSPGQVRLSIERALADSPRRWRLWQLALRSRYLAALCAECSGTGPVAIVVREVVPLLSERTVETVLLRASAPPDRHSARGGF